MPFGLPRRSMPLALLLAIFAAGCVALGVSSDDDPMPGAPADADAGYRLERGELRSESGCRFAYRRFEPMKTAATSVLIGHGFLRDQTHMSGLAAALARAGIRAITLDFCNMKFWNGHHVRNAADLARLARELEIDRPVYAGFSAGALAALIAAADDPATRALVTLDLVLQAPLGREAIARLDAPWLALHGPPSSCNANLNASPIYTERQVERQDERRDERRIERYETASHCEFESPTDGVCETFCGDPDGAENDQAQRRAIIERVVDWVSRLEPTDEAPPNGAGPSVL